MDFSKIAVLLTSHPRQQLYWPIAMQSWLGYPGKIFLGYDDVSDEAIRDFIDSLGLDIEVQVTGERSTHVRGELRQMRSLGLLAEERGFTYFFKSAADSTCYRWRALSKFVSALRGHEMIVCGTALMFGKLSAFNKVLDAYHIHFKTGGAELFCDSQIRKYNMAVRRERGPWWEENLGRIHVQGEHALNLGKNIQWTWEVGEIWPITS